MNMGPAKTLIKETEHHEEEKKEENKNTAMAILGIEKDKEDSVLENNAIIIEIEGRVNCGVIPKYRQRGEIAELRSDKYYLLINLLKVEKIQAPESIATVNTFVTIEWGGQTKRTATIYDSYQPVYNQLFAFKIPVKKGLEKDKKALTKFLKAELEPNNYVIFDLWLEGDGGSNDNLGSYTFPLADIQMANREERTYRDSKTKKNTKYVSKILEVNKKMVSGEDESGTGQILFEIWLLPDLEDINLAEFSKIRGDRFPPELSVSPEEEAKRVDRWIEAISKSFLQKTPTKVRLRNFNTVYVKDQYAKKHFISMYIGKFTMNTYDNDKEGIEPEELEFLESDRRVSTLAEIAHYVRCIPFSSDRNSDIWNSPNSVPIMKKGNPLDHALLMACLFMACKTETNEDLERIIKEKESKKKFGDIAKGISHINLRKKDHHEDKSTLGLDLRTFVCVGTHKLTKTTCFWVMTIDPDLTGVTLWETTYNKKYHLAGRITEPTKLRAFLKNEPEEKQTTKKGGLGFMSKGFNLLGDLNKEDGEDDDEKDAKDGKDGKKDNKKKNKGKKVAITANVPDDDGEELQPVEADDHDLFGPKTIKREKIRRACDLPIVFERGFLEDLRKEFADPDAKQTTTSDAKERKTKSNFLEREEEETRKAEEVGDAKRLRAVQEFKDISGLAVKKVFVPYASLELIFNNQNVWASLQHQDPSSIYYNLFDKNAWKPFLTHRLPNGDEAAWRKKLGIFFNFGNIKPPMNERELKKLKTEIIKAVNFGIENARSGFNLATKWKHPNDKVVKHLVKYLRQLEYRDTERWDDSKLKEETQIWEKELRKMMPKNGRFACLPMFFTYSEPERIKSIVVKDAASFYKTDEKNAIFAIGCKIFPYPGGFNSVRIILAYFCPIPEEELDEEQEEEASRRDSDVEIDPEDKALIDNANNDAQLD